MSKDSNTNKASLECEHFNEKLSGYVDGELTQQESQRIALHIESCSICAKRVNEIEQLTLAIKGSEMPQMESDKYKGVKL